MTSRIHRVSNVDTETKTGLCANCGPVKLKKKSSRGGGVRWACRPSEAKWRTQVGRLGPVERERRFREQGGQCAICHLPRPLVVDHCHTSGRVRGLLCNRCNSVLSEIERPGWLDAAHVYLSTGA